MDVQFIDAAEDGSKDFSGVKQGEVVILPAFGASVQEMLLLSERQVQIVDTTCPWVRCVCSGQLGNCSMPAVAGTASCAACAAYAAKCHMQPTASSFLNLLPLVLPALTVWLCSKVWNAVDNQARKGHTSIIHGKWEHEETVATASFAGASGMRGGQGGGQGRAARQAWENRAATAAC